MCANKLINLIILGKNKNIKTKEEHIVLIQEPSSKYIGHVTPKDGSAKQICNSILDFITLEVASNILAIGTDGTAVNTGLYMYLLNT